MENSADAGIERMEHFLGTDDARNHFAKRKKENVFGKVSVTIIKKALCYVKRSLLLLQGKEIAILTDALYCEETNLVKSFVIICRKLCKTVIYNNCES